MVQHRLISDNLSLLHCRLEGHTLDTSSWLATQNLPLLFHITLAPIATPSKLSAGKCAPSLGSWLCCSPHLLVTPAYFALQGYTAVWDDSSTVLTCVEEKKGAQHKSIIIACAVAAVAVLAAALLLWRQYLRTRPRWLRERLLQVKQLRSILLCCSLYVQPCDGHSEAICLHILQCTSAVYVCDVKSSTVVLPIHTAVVGLTPAAFTICRRPSVPRARPRPNLGTRC